MYIYIYIYIYIYYRISYINSYISPHYYTDDFDNSKSLTLHQWHAIGLSMILFIFSLVIISAIIYGIPKYKKSCVSSLSLHECDYYF